MLDICMSKSEERPIFGDGAAGAVFHDAGNLKTEHQLAGSRDESGSLCVDHWTLQSSVQMWGFICACTVLCLNLYNLLHLIAGIGMDACITPIRHGGLSLVQSTSFFYVLVDDPYMMVKQFFCNCNFCSHVYFCSWEWKCHGWNIRYRELSYPGTPWNFCSQERKLCGTLAPLVQILMVELHCKKNMRKA